MKAKLDWTATSKAMPPRDTNRDPERAPATHSILCELIMRAPGCDEKARLLDGYFDFDTSMWIVERGYDDRYDMESIEECLAWAPKLYIEFPTDEIEGWLDE